MRVLRVIGCGLCLVCLSGAEGFKVPKGMVPTFNPPKTLARGVTAPPRTAAQRQTAVQSAPVQRPATAARPAPTKPAAASAAKPPAAKPPAQAPTALAAPPSKPATSSIALPQAGRLAPVPPPALPAIDQTAGLISPAIGLQGVSQPHGFLFAPPPAQPVKPKAVKEPPKRPDPYLATKAQLGQAVLQQPGDAAPDKLPALNAVALPATLPSPTPELIRAVRELIDAAPPSSPAYELEAAARDLATRVPVEHHYYTRYLSYYAFPPGERETAEKVVTFWLNSLSQVADISPQVRVGQKGSYLTRIDIRNYGYDPVFWEKLAQKDPFFVEPWVSHDYAGYLREATKSNAILRADWFLFMTSDGTEDTGYYDLLYGKGAPKVVNDFTNAWGVDFDRVVKQYQADQGVNVDEGDSLVSLHNRSLWRLRTVLGSYWGTFDVLESVGERDYAEHIFVGEEGSKFDAQEHIASMPNGLQAYLLSDGAQNKVEFGDPAVVRDSTDPHGDPRVRNPVSCVRCHTQGMNRPISMLKAYENKGVRILADSPELARRIESFFSDVEPQIQEDNARYAAAVYRCNGWAPKENAAAFTKLIAWYENPVTLGQAARECGVEVERLAKTIQASPRGRLHWLVTDGGKVPRKTWDKQLFAQSMLLLQALPAK